MDGTPCLAGIATDDVEPAVAGLQLDGEVVDRHTDGQGRAHDTPLPRCPVSGGSCWSVDPTLTCSGLAPGLELQIHRVEDVPVPSTVVARCAAGPAACATPQ